MKKKNIAYIFIAVMLLLCCTVGCTAKPTTWSLIIDGNEIPVDTVLTVNSEKISLFEYRFYFASLKETADNGDDSYWLSNQDARDKLIKDTLNAIRYDRAKVELAQSLGIKLTKEDKTAINNYVKKYKSMYTDKEWQDLLDESYMDEAFYTQYNMESLYDDKLEDYYFGNESGNKLTVSRVFDYMQEYYHYKYIYVKFDYDNTDTNQKLIENISQQLADGAKFEDMMVYSRDYTEDYANKGYYIKKEGVSPVIDNVSKLEVGEISNIIKQDNGYYIYKRYDITEDDAKDNLAEFKEQYMSEFISKKVMEIVEKQKIEYISEYYNKISIETLLHN